ncbi:hypothetical protein [Thiosocius teredinicola]|uniref:hypothetical protein n=1 Tax=Thiosocius teredinicola TaxID=1973002 RepID=UPI0013DDBA47
MIWSCKILVVCCVPLALNACAVNRVGFTSFDVTKLEGGWVIVQSVPGLHIRTESKDAGLTVGYSERVCLVDDDSFDGIVGSHHWDGRQMPAAESCLSRYLSAYGLEVHLSPPLISFTIGIKRTAILADFDGTDYQVYSVFFDTKNPSSGYINFVKNRRSTFDE